MTDADARLEGCMRMADALLDAMDAAVRSSDLSYVWRFTSYRQFMRKANELIEMTATIEPILAPVDLYNLDAVPTSGNTVAPMQQELFESVRSNLFLLRAYLANRVHPKSERVAEFADFFASNLRRAMLRVPEKERDVQDVVEQLFIGRGMQKGIDYDRETGRVKVSAKEVIPDFVLPLLGTAVEVKLVKESSQIGRVIDEINADVRSYTQKYEAVLFLVYDIGGAIRDEAEFRSDLEARAQVRVLVVKH